MFTVIIGCVAGHAYVSIYIVARAQLRRPLSTRADYALHKLYNMSLSEQYLLVLVSSHQ